MGSVAGAPGTSPTQPPEAGDPVTEVRFLAPVDLYRRIQQIATEQGWPAEEAILTVLSYGVAYVTGQADVDQINRGEADVREALERFHSMAMQLDASNAVLKFRAYELGLAVRTLEWNVTGLKGENELAKTRLEMYRSEVRELKEQIAALQRANERLQRELAAAGGEPKEPCEPCQPVLDAAATPTRLRSLAAGLRRALRRSA